MTVILREDHTVPLVTVNIWYRVGSKDEPPHHSGFAHLFEHLMFMGTHRVPTGQYDKIMEGGGGNNNASTAEDRTNFYSTSALPTFFRPCYGWRPTALKVWASEMDAKEARIFSATW